MLFLTWLVGALVATHQLSVLHQMVNMYFSVELLMLTCSETRTDVVLVLVQGSR